MIWEYTEKQLSIFIKLVGYLWLALGRGNPPVLPGDDTPISKLPSQACTHRLQYWGNSQETWHRGMAQSFCQSSLFINVHFPSKFLIHWRPSFMNNFPPSKVDFHQRSSFIKRCLLSNFGWYQTSSSVERRVPLSLSSIKGCLPSRVSAFQYSLLTMSKGPRDGHHVSA